MLHLLCYVSTVYFSLFFSLDTNYEVKISDSALTQCFFPECYSTVRGTVRPVRWAAIETLQEGLCTSQSNVVSNLWKYTSFALSAVYVIVTDRHSSNHGSLLLYQVL